MAAALLAAPATSFAEMPLADCASLGRGFLLVPETQTCLSFGGYSLAEFHARDTKMGRFGWRDPAASGFASRARGAVKIEARTPTEFGLLRSHVEGHVTVESGQTYAVLDHAFVEFERFLAGRAQSRFDFFTGFGPDPYWHGAYSDSRVNLMAYRLPLGAGGRLTLSVEDPTTGDGGRDRVEAAQATGLRAPDLVAAALFDAAWGSAQAMGVLRPPSGGGVALGWAVGAGAEVKPGVLFSGTRIAAQAAIGERALGYVNGHFLGFATDAGADRIGRAWSLAAGLEQRLGRQLFLHLDIGATWAEIVRAGDLRQWDAAFDIAWRPSDGLTLAPGLAWRRLEPLSPNDVSPQDEWIAGVRLERSF